MRLSISWLKELVDFNLTSQQLADQLSLKSIGVKQEAEDFLELDLTYNRGDLLSIRGIAREVAAITGSKLTSDRVDLFWKSKDLPKTAVRIEEEILSSLQAVAKIENLKVEKSDDTWIKKLSECGMRSVNNLVDVTNLMMLEFGQPFHAFDAEKVNDETIIVRLAKDGEQITTLDGKQRLLNCSDIVLADTQKSLDVAGVMGSKETEVSDSTSTILLSASLFNPVMVRKTSKKLGLSSEASKRFQHGLTKTNLLEALSAAIRMYENLGGKLIAISLVGDLEDNVKVINLTQEKVNSLLGIAIPKDQIETSLKSLGFALVRVGVNVNHPEGGLAWHVTVPYWRLDINIEEDLIEEVARMYGYEKIEGVKLADEKIPDLVQTLPKFIHDLKLKLKEIGLTEVQTYSFYSSAVLQALGFTREDISSLLKIANPISSETEYLRQDIWPNLLEVVGKNIRKGFKDIGIFEIGKVYWVESGEPKEAYRLSIALMNNIDNPIEELSILGSNLEGCKLNPSVSQQLFHPKRFMRVEKDDKQVGFIAEIHLRLLNKLGIEKRVATFEIDLED